MPVETASASTITYRSSNQGFDNLALTETDLSGRSPRPLSFRKKNSRKNFSLWSRIRSWASCRTAVRKLPSPKIDTSKEAETHGRSTSKWKTSKSNFVSNKTMYRSFVNSYVYTSRYDVDVISHGKRSTNKCILDRGFQAKGFRILGK